MEQNDSHMLPTFAVESLALLAWMGSYLMNADVEKAVEYIADAVGHYPDIRDKWAVVTQALRDQEAEIARLKDAVMRKEGELSTAWIRASSGNALLREALGEVYSNIGYMALHKVTDGSLESSKAVAYRITAHLGGEQ